MKFIVDEKPLCSSECHFSIYSTKFYECSIDNETCGDTEDCPYLISFKEYQNRTADRQ